MTAEQHFQAISDWLYNRYGKHPQPRRSYIEGREVLDLMCDNPVCHNATRDLATGKYPGKWRRGVECAIVNAHDPATLTFWMKARKTYIELGGGYVDGMQPLHND